MKNKSSWLKFVSIGFTVIMIVGAFFLFRDCDIKEILEFTPDNLVAAAFVIIAIYAAKSMSMVFPVSVLLMASGIMYSFSMAMLINIVGVVVCFTIPYFSGKLIGRDTLRKFIEKYPKVKKVFEKSRSNNVMTAYIVRTVGVPTDVGSMIMGASGISYKAFIIGSVMGMIPRIIFYTVIGNSADGSFSAGKIILLAVTAVSMFLISFLVNRYTKRKEIIS